MVMDFRAGDCSLAFSVWKALKYGGIHIYPSGISPGLTALAQRFERVTSGLQSILFAQLLSDPGRGRRRMARDSPAAA